MTHPRRVEPGAVLFISRRTLRRYFLFRPDPVMNQIFAYLLAVVAERHGIELHAATLMSTHEHLQVTDHRGNFPLFIHELHRLVALATKAHRKWEGPVWDAAKASVVRLVTPSAMVEKLAYARVNPVKAGLVERPEEWPGVSMGVDSQGDSFMRVKRPEAYLDAESGRWPDEVVVRMTTPKPVLDAYGQEGARERLDTEIARQVRNARQELSDSRRKFLGVRRILAMKPWRRATNSEPIRGLEPHVAAGRGRTRARVAAIRALQAFRAAYRAARQLWSDGDRTAVFPFGTWGFARYHAALVAAG